MTDILSDAEMIVVSAVAPFIEAQLSKIYPEGWIQQVNKTRQGPRETILAAPVQWDLSDLLRTMDDFWHDIWPAFAQIPKNRQVKSVEIKSYVVLLKQLRNRARHTPRTTFSEKDRRRFVDLAEHLVDSVEDSAAAEKLRNLLDYATGDTAAEQGVPAEGSTATILIEEMRSLMVLLKEPSASHSTNVALEEEIQSLRARVSSLEKLKGADFKSRGSRKPDPEFIHPSLEWVGVYVTLELNQLMNVRVKESIRQVLRRFGQVEGSLSEIDGRNLYADLYVTPGKGLAQHMSTLEGDLKRVTGVSDALAIP